MFTFALSYLVISFFASVFVFAACAASARADEIQQEAFAAYAANAK